MSNLHMLRLVPVKLSFSLTTSCKGRRSCVVKASDPLRSLLQLGRTENLYIHFIRDMAML